LPWGATRKFFGIDASVSGFSLVQTIFSMFDTRLFKSGEVTLIVAATFVFLLSPICCHAISLLQLLAQSLPSKLILVFPLVVWILEGLYLLLRTEGELLRALEFASVGFIGTVVGMLIAAFPLLPVDKSALANKNAAYNATQEFCVKCGASLTHGAVYCGKCGTKVKAIDELKPKTLPTASVEAKPWKCPQCSADNNADAYVCAKCGYSLL
jgi:ribosomal protein L40E